MVTTFRKVPLRQLHTAKGKQEGGGGGRAAGSAEGRVSLTLAGAGLLAEGLHGREGEPVVPLRHN